MHVWTTNLAVYYDLLSWVSARSSELIVLYIFAETKKIANKGWNTQGWLLIIDAILSDVPI